MMKPDPIGQKFGNAKKLWRDKGGVIMIHRYVNKLIEYWRLTDFSARSIQALEIRLNEFKAYLKF